MGIHIMPPLYKMVITPPVTELVVYAEDGDGDVACADTDYTTIHDASDGTQVRADIDNFIVQQSVTGASKNIFRSVIPFDTSPIPAGAVIVSAILGLDYHILSYDGSDIWTLVIVDGRGLASTLELADYGRLLNQVTSGGSILASALSGGGYRDITLNPVGRSWINKGDITRLALRMDFDINSHEHWGGCSFHSAESVDKKPKFTINYYVQ